MSENPHADEILKKIADIDLSIALIGFSSNDTPMLSFLMSGRKDPKEYFREIRHAEMESELRVLSKCRATAAEVVALGGPDLSDILDDAEKAVRECGSAT